MLGEEKQKFFETQHILNLTHENFQHKKKVGIRAGSLAVGSKIQTAGGNIGIVTGKQTKNLIQIKLESGEMLGKYDWMDKEALAQEIIPGGVLS